MKTAKEFLGVGGLGRACCIMALNMNSSGTPDHDLYKEVSENVCRDRVLVVATHADVLDAGTLDADALDTSRALKIASYASVGITGSLGYRRMLTTKPPVPLLGGVKESNILVTSLLRTALHTKDMQDNGVQTPDEVKKHVFHHFNINSV